MENGFQFVSGDFEGNYFTNQKSALTYDELAYAGKLHYVNLYRGDLRNVQIIDAYKPEDHLNRDGLLLNNVTNIQLHPGKDSPITEKKIYDFDQVVLKNVEVVNTWELNDKTYGIIRGQLVGKIKKLSSIPIGSDSLGDTIKIPPPPVARQFGGGGGGIENGNRGCLSFFYRGSVGSVAGSSGNYVNGDIFSDFWNVLKFFMLVLLVIFLVKQCKSCSNQKNDNATITLTDSSLFRTNDSLRRQIKLLKETIALNDSLCEKRIEKQKIQHELDNLSSQIFFNGGTTNIRDYSSDEIDNIVKILNKYPNLKLEIQGFYNGDAPNVRLDIERANRVKELIIDKGIDQSRISAVGLGNTKPLVDKDYLELDPFGNKYNKNMRVEIKIIKY